MFYSTQKETEMTEDAVRRLGLNPSDTYSMALFGIYPIVNALPEYDPATEIVDMLGLTFDEEQRVYRRVFAVAPIPDEVLLSNAKTAKFAEFDTLFARLDALKIRPAASIAEAVAASEPTPQGDAYRLSELEAITQENRDLRDLVAIAETVEAVQEVSVWWPEGE